MNEKQDLESSLLKKLKNLASEITVEPILLLYITSSMMATLTTENLNLEKSCRVNIGYNESVCDAMVVRDEHGYTDLQEISVQKLVSNMLVYKTAIQGMIPFLLMLFLGSWSDRHNKRKPFILMPIFGDIVACIGYILCTYFFLELPVEYAIFFETIPVAITGGWFCFFVGISSYVTEKSSLEGRTMKIGLMTMCTHVSLTMGIAMSGITYRVLKFYGVYSLSIMMFLIAVLLGFVIINETEKEREGIRAASVKNLFQDIFDYHHVVSTLSVVIEKKPHNRRKKLFLVIVLILLIVGSYRGELVVMYMFTRRKFTWDELDYSGYNTYHSITQMLGALLCLAIFVKWMKVDDAMLGMIGMISKIIGSLGSGFAPSPLYFYLAALTEIFNGSSHIAMRSIMSKLVTPEELGQTFAIFGLCEALTPLFFGPLYSFVYQQTIDVFSGAFYFLSAILHLGAFAVFLWLYLLRTEVLVVMEQEKMVSLQYILQQSEVNETSKLKQEDIMNSRNSKKV